MVESTRLNCYFTTDKRAKNSLAAVRAKNSSAAVRAKNFLAAVNDVGSCGDSLNMLLIILCIYGFFLFEYFYHIPNKWIYFRPEKSVFPNERHKDSETSKFRRSNKVDTNYVNMT